MKKIIISLLLIISLCVSIFGGSASAKERKFKRQDTKFTYVGEFMADVFPMYCAKNGKVKYMRYDIKYKAETYADFNIDAIEGKKIKKISSFKERNIENGDIFYDARALDDNVNLTIRMGRFGKKEKAVIKEYDKKGKNIFTYKDDKNLINAFRLRGWDDGRNIYYTYMEMSRNESSCVFHTRCINKKSKKVKDMRSFKLNAMEVERTNSNNLKIEKGKLYVLCKEKINVYSLNGKLLKTCRLPEGERTIHIQEDYDPEIGTYLTFNYFSVCGDYLYYCNRNGIYRWNMKGKDGFKLYYNAEGDEYFGPGYGAEDICVKDENTIYIMISKLVEGHHDELQKIVKYSR